MSSERPGAVIARVEPGSIAAELGLRPGDRIKRIHGRVPRDVIDIEYYSAEGYLTLTVATLEGEEVFCEVEKDPTEPLGIHFTSDLFHPLKTCNNDCLFCFIRQAPPNLRPTVYVRDDDYRLSFLYGHFITLTNLTEAHFERIVEQRLSPLYVSVHTTNPALRRLLFNNPQAPRGWDYLQRLCAAGIQCHTQLVLCPGINDGPELERSLSDLSALWPQVRSVAAVPVGLTRFQPHRDRLRPYARDEARQVLHQLAPWQERFLREAGTRFVYAADEFFFLADQPIPSAEYYDDFLQVENGVGLTRLFLDEAAEVLREAPPAVSPPRHVTVITGELGGRVLADMVARLNEIAHLTVDLTPVPNRFFGETVTVAGLLTGQDILAALRPCPRPDLYLLPAVALNQDGLLLDDLRPADLERELGAPVVAVSGARELAETAWASRPFNGETTDTSAGPWPRRTAPTAGRSRSHPG
jgi:putative radical SAM enzyme (TIGR03279 family)